MANDIKKKWVTQNFNKWRFEYEVYDEDTTFNGAEIKKGRITHGGMAIRNLYHADYRMAFDIRTHAVWVFPGNQAVKEGFKAKKLVLGIPDFEQVKTGKFGQESFNVVKYKINETGTRSGIPLNFDVYSNSIEGEMIVKWKSKEKIFGPKSGHLYITQKFVFTKYASTPYHEPTGVINAARFHPMTYIYYENRNDKYISSVRVDYRMHLSLDTYQDRRTMNKTVHGQMTDVTYYQRTQKSELLRNHVGLFKDEDNFDLKSSGYPANRAVFDAAEKPIVAEVIGYGLKNGNNVSSIEKHTEHDIFGNPSIKKIYNPTWDNVHWWGAGGNIHATAPGAFHALHIHWRWGESLHEHNDAMYALGVKGGGYAQFVGQSKGGVLTDPFIENQTIKFAVIKKKGNFPTTYADHSTKDFDSFFKKLRKIPESTNTDSETGGHDFVLYYSSEIYRKQPLQHDYMRPSGSKGNLEDTVNEPLMGYVFLHGIFFAHEDEITPSSLAGSNETYYISPSESDIKKTSWNRNPKA